MYFPPVRELFRVAVISLLVFSGVCLATGVGPRETLSTESQSAAAVKNQASNRNGNPQNAQGNKGSSSQDTRNLLSKNPACAEDVLRVCDKSLHHNNFAVLDCVQNKKAEELDISPECHNVMWSFKRNLTRDDRFVDAAKSVCGTEIGKYPDCVPLENIPGHLLSCLMEMQDNITNLQCKQFLTKMESIVFSDYRLIYQFTDHCETDINRFKCGRLAKDDPAMSHSQGSTIECLSKNPKELAPDCQHEILRIAEIQSEDFHLDRPLFFACRDDRERLCENVQAGDGRVYRCLLHHKTHKLMSHECRDKLIRRQKLINLDYKVSKGLVKACREDIRTHRCREETSKNREIRLVQILLCLEDATHKGFTIDGECQAEMLDHRRGLMEDYQLNPSVVGACNNDITKFCNEKLEGNGRTIHCLMEHARPSTRKKKRISEGCKRELELLMHETDVGEDWRVDPVLKEACQSVVDVACKDIQAGKGRVLSCLMDKVGSTQMTEECEDTLLQIQYFIARDFRLDTKLYHSCRNDAKTFCNAGENWADDPNKMGPHRGPILPCLFRYAHSSSNTQRLSKFCVQEVKRVMRQRANNVDLHPEIEIACINDLADRCLEKVDKGEEIVCLQDNLENLENDCQEAIRNYTEEEAESIEFNKVVYKACEPLIKKYCEDLVGDNTAHADAMQCLANHKNDYEMSNNEKCHAAVAHFQLISLKDYRFTFSFKEACKKDVVELCKNVRTKSEVVTCLSESVRNDTLYDRTPRVSKECRKQLRVELLQRNEDIQLDPILNEACSMERSKYCATVQPGHAQVIECLKDHQKDLSEKCHFKIFNRQQEEMLDNSVDYTLMSVCKNMIKEHCDEDPVESLTCLKTKVHDINFDSKCRSVVLKRMAQQNVDYRLNPNLRKACSSEVKKFCRNIVDNGLGNEPTYEGKVIACLKMQFVTHKLRKSCEDELRNILANIQLDYRQDPVLAEACKDEISLHCSGSNFLDAEGQGKVEECLKLHFQSHDFKSIECNRQVARLIQEGSADVHVDHQLLDACDLSLKAHCSSILPGEGRQMKCLLDIATSKNSHFLDDKCKEMLLKRVDMYRSAMKVAPENVQDIVNQVVISPARNYFIVVGLAVLGLIFISGLFCGRFTKRVHYEMKRK